MLFFFNQENYKGSFLFFNFSHVFAERIGVWLSFNEIDDSSQELSPLILVVLPKVLSYLYDAFIELLYPTVDVTLLWLSNRSEFVLLLYHLRQIPQFGRSSHIFDLLPIVKGLQVFEVLGSSFQFLVLPFFAREHAFSNARVFDVLVDCFVDMFKHFDSILNDLVSEFLVAVVFPNPVPA